MQGKCLTIFISILVGMTTILPNFSIAKTDKHNFSNLEIKESHLIEGIPYIGQKTNFHCCFASILMILQYYGLNITLPELLFYSGSSYSLYYQNHSPFIYQRLPNYCYQLSHEPATCNFIADLYGLSYITWTANTSLPDDKRWNEDWNRIKENISNNIPVIVRVDEIILASDNLGFGFLYPLLKFFPASLHSVLIVGFNENNHTVCYSDPFYGIGDKPHRGKYRWIDLEKFKTSIIKSNKRKGATSILVRIFIDTPESPLSIDEAFNLSHKRNIERLKGNYSAYNEGDLDDTERHLFGINALKGLRQDLRNGFNYRIKTFYRYKLNNRLGIIYRMTDRLYLRFPNLFPYHPGLIILELNDCFENIGIEKKIFAEYLSEVQELLTDDDMIEISNHESKLFEEEAENWTKLAEYYSMFRKRGMFMTLFLGIQIIKKMETVIDNIIATEQAIIDGTCKN